MSSQAENGGTDAAVTRTGLDQRVGARPSSPYAQARKGPSRYRPDGSGKSTLAQNLAEQLGWESLSEDAYWVENG